MNARADLWVVVPGWDRFQHYHDRDPVWIKLYLDLRSREEWRGLTLAARGLLVSIWVEYAAAGCLLKYRSLPSRVAQKVQSRTLDSLVEAGLLVLSASPPARPPARGETEKKREEPPLSPPQGGNGSQRFTSTPKRSRSSSNGDEPKPATAATVMAAMLRWLQSPAFDPATMSEATLLEELDAKERKLRAAVTPKQREELAAIARQRREGYGEQWDGREP